MKKNALFLLVGLLVSGSCFAERLLAASFYGQPVMLLNGGAVQSCGIRFVGVETPANPTNPKESIWFPDTSFMLDRRGYGMVKAILNKSTVGDINIGNKKQTNQPFKTFWIKAPNADATKPVKGEAIDGETQGSKLYVTAPISVMELYAAVSKHKPIQLGIKFDDDANDFALYGEVTLSEQDFNQVASCMSELMGLIQKDVEKSAKK